MIRPELIGTITRRHGAWLISLDPHDLFGALAPVDSYDAAGSLAVAKSVLKKSAREVGCTHLKWVPGSAFSYPEGVVVLMGVVPDPGGKVGY